MPRLIHTSGGEVFSGIMWAGRGSHSLRFEGVLGVGGEVPTACVFGVCGVSGICRPSAAAVYAELPPESPIRGPLRVSLHDLDRAGLNGVVSKE